MRLANQKANGSWSGGASSAPMSVVSSSDVTPQESVEGAPKVFRQRNSQRFIMEISKAEMASAAAASAGRAHPGTPGCGNPRQGPSGRGRQVRLGLPRRRRPAHLRRVLQAGHHPACAGAPRTGRRSRSRRLCPRHGRCRRGAGHLRSRCDQCGHRYCHGLHGQHPDGDHQRAGADAADRTGCVPGVRHRRHHAPDRQAQFPGQGRASTWPRS